MEFLKEAGLESREYQDVIRGEAAVTILFRKLMKKKSAKKIFLSAFKIILKSLAAFFFATAFIVLLLKWIDPPTSSIMIQRKISALFSGKEKQVIINEWADYNSISKYMALAVVASEDQNFPTHFGFDVEQIEKAIKKSQRGGRLRGASTITQQVAKNLFLWEGKSFIRKGIEAYFTVLIELLWSKQRILEVYLNITEMGDMIFGIKAASEIYFHKPPSKISAEQAALIAATLPNPLRFSAMHPSGYTIRRKFWIMSQMNSLGGVSYLNNL
jgi:monofunctional glycosyltransferase